MCIDDLFTMPIYLHGGHHHHHQIDLTSDIKDEETSWILSWARQVCVYVLKFFFFLFRDGKKQHAFFFHLAYQKLEKNS